MIPRGRERGSLLYPDMLLVSSRPRVLIQRCSDSYRDTAPRPQQHHQQQQQQQQQQKQQRQHYNAAGYSEPLAACVLCRDKLLLLPPQTAAAAASSATAAAASSATAAAAAAAAALQRSRVQLTSRGLRLVSDKLLLLPPSQTAAACALLYFFRCWQLATKHGTHTQTSTKKNKIKRAARFCPPPHPAPERHPLGAHSASASTPSSQLPPPPPPTLSLSRALTLCQKQHFPPSCSTRSTEQPINPKRQSETGANNSGGNPRTQYHKTPPPPHSSARTPLSLFPSS